LFCGSVQFGEETEAEDGTDVAEEPDEGAPGEPGLLEDDPQPASVRAISTAEAGTRSRPRICLSLSVR
jgi:hypothetical protein